jgi:hypothetical protein
MAQLKNMAAKNYPKGSHHGPSVKRITVGKGPTAANPNAETKSMVTSGMGKRFMTGN